MFLTSMITTLCIAQKPHVGNLHEIGW